MGNKWDNSILEIVGKKEISKPALSNINCVKTGIDHNSVMKPTKDKIESVESGSLSKLAHREKVFSEIKLFFKFKQQEVYITCLLYTSDAADE